LKDRQSLLLDSQLSNFKKFTRGRHNISYTDPNDQDEIWWALGQHHGLQTPLLDWVRTPYVASFFSFIEKEKGEQSRAVFILDIEKIKQILRAYNQSKSNTHEFDMGTIKIIDLLTHDNKRLVSQQGLFTYIEPSRYKDVQTYLDIFQERCRDQIAGEILLLKITIPPKERSHVLEQLDLMNINEVTLFPDVDGSAKYCNYLLKK